MVLIKENGKLVEACSMMLSTGDRSKLNKIKGENDLGTYCETIRLLIKEYDKKRKAKS